MRENEREFDFVGHGFRVATLGSDKCPGYPTTNSRNETKRRHGDEVVETVRNDRDKSLAVVRGKRRVKSTITCIPRNERSRDCGQLLCLLETGIAIDIAYRSMDVIQGNSYEKNRYIADCICGLGNGRPRPPPAGAAGPITPGTPR